jgi:hypothetical protein
LLVLRPEELVRRGLSGLPACLLLALADSMIQVAALMSKLFDLIP